MFNDRRLKMSKVFEEGAALNRSSALGGAGGQLDASLQAELEYGDHAARAAGRPLELHDARREKQNKASGAHLPSEVFCLFLFNLHFPLSVLKGLLDISVAFSRGRKHMEAMGSFDTSHNLLCKVILWFWWN